MVGDSESNLASATREREHTVPSARAPAYPAKLFGQGSIPLEIYRLPLLTFAAGVGVNPTEADAALLKAKEKKADPHALVIYDGPELGNKVLKPRHIREARAYGRAEALHSLLEKIMKTGPIRGVLGTFLAEERLVEIETEMALFRLDNEARIIDPETGLYTMAGLALELKDVGWARTWYALDGNGTKPLNDGIGHGYVDELIEICGKALALSGRKNITPGEFSRERRSSTGNRDLIGSKPNITGDEYFFGLSENFFADEIPRSTVYGVGRRIRDNLVLAQAFALGNDLPERINSKFIDRLVENGIRKGSLRPKTYSPEFNLADYIKAH